MNNLIDEKLKTIYKLQPYLVYIDSIFYISGSVIPVTEFKRYIDNISHLKKHADILEIYQSYTKNNLHLFFDEYISIFSAKDIKNYINGIFRDRLVINRADLIEGLEDYNILNEEFINHYLEKSIYFDQISDRVKKNFLTDDFE
ncbi:hypothetical protein [Candidatus Cetobacterium colombiensis]|uniref:Uncharacterized protein n=1 Tax=Candidatus Cetobacterium colombiensis TaxID=3073100 RepID=A0ABU4W8S4_9FUSO|nr:hypothetical protein [Candidatus Cetobacterium colombiensis]MDX8335629.1 hypothetical protein [Candidatus Cetobacterium colombiensis]